MKPASSRATATATFDLGLFAATMRRNRRHNRCCALSAIAITRAGWPVRIDTLTAMLILAELHDFRRFRSARALMAFLGLVPSEDSSGEKHRCGRITKMGNALVSRILVEASWHYQHRQAVGHALNARRPLLQSRTWRAAQNAARERQLARCGEPGT
jgi:transposase